MGARISRHSDRIYGIGDSGCMAQGRPLANGKWSVKLWEPDELDNKIVYLAQDDVLAFHVAQAWCKSREVLPYA